MAGRKKSVIARTLVSFRLMDAQINRLNMASKELGKSRTAIVREAISYYLNMMHRDGAI